MTKILKLEAENFKRLRAVEITPGEHTVVISGNNAQGKSSVLDAIQAALAGKKGVRELVEPIRQGENKARVILELEDIKVTRTWSPSGSQLVVGPRDGTAKFNSPQAILDKLIGALAFDPLEFAEADPKTQADKLIDVLDLRGEFNRIALERKYAYENRTEVNRDVKRYQAEVDQRADAREVAPVDVSRLSIELEAAIEVERARDDWQNIETRIAELRAQQAKLTAAAQAVVANVNPRPSTEVRGEMTRVGDINREAQRWIDREAARDYLAQADAESAKLTVQIEQLDDEKRSLIANSKLPVEGLSFDEDGISLNGVPFIQASAAERLKVSVAMAMAMNPDLRVICIRDASLLDPESFSVIESMAVKQNFQIWYEMVGDHSEIGVVIEDGAVRS